MLSRFIFKAMPWKGGSAMRATLGSALDVLETVGAIISVVVPATRAVVSLLEPNKAE